MHQVWSGNAKRFEFLAQVPFEPVVIDECGSKHQLRAQYRHMQIVAIARYLGEKAIPSA